MTHGSKLSKSPRLERPGDEPDLGAPGVRELIRPVTPTLPGAAARALPGSTPATWPDYDRSIQY